MKITIEINTEDKSDVVLISLLRHNQIEVAAGMIGQRIANEINNPKKNIINAVSAISGYGIDDLIGKNRTRNISVARHVLHFLLNVYVGYTLEETGLVTGRDHGTVLNSVYKVNNMLDTNDVYIRKYKGLIKSVKKQMKC